MLTNNKKTGFVKLYRSMLDNPICCQDTEYFAIWIYLLLHATPTEKHVLFRGKKILLYPGQLIITRKEISEFLNISEAKIQRVLVKLTDETQISQQMSNRSRLISIINWGEYQQKEQIEEKSTVKYYLRLFFNYLNMLRCYVTHRHVTQCKKKTKGINQNV